MSLIQLDVRELNVQYKSDQAEMLKDRLRMMQQ